MRLTQQKQHTPTLCADQHASHQPAIQETTEPHQPAIQVQQTAAPSQIQGFTTQSQLLWRQSCWLVTPQDSKAPSLPCCTQAATNIDLTASARVCCRTSTQTTPYPITCARTKAWQSSICLRRQAAAGHPLNGRSRRPFKRMHCDICHVQQQQHGLA